MIKGQEDGETWVDVWRTAMTQSAPVKSRRKT